MTLRLYPTYALKLFSDIAKRNYELESVKYLLQGKKTRENPLADGLLNAGGAPAG